jgi:hypothetical protein
LLRRIFPFYGWLKGITLATGRLALHHPTKTALMVAISQASEETFSDLFGQGYELLRSALQFHRERGELGVVADVLTTRGLNPFQTVSDNIEFLEGLLLDQKVGFGSENPANAFGPVIQAVIEAGQGTDLFTGEPIEGPGGFVGRAAQQFAGSFPQERVIRGSFFPESKTTGRGDPRMTVPGVTYGGLPAELLQYLGAPFRRYNLGQAARVAEREAMADVSSADRAYQEKMATLRKRAKQFGLLSSPDYRQAKAALSHWRALENALDAEEIAVGDYDHRLRIAADYGIRAMPQFAPDFRQLEKDALSGEFMGYTSEDAYRKIRDVLFTDWLEPWNLGR